MTSDPLEFLLQQLQQENYFFLCPSPETHARYLKCLPSPQKEAEASSLNDIFGWSLPVTESTLKKLLHNVKVQGFSSALRSADAQSLLQPKIRVSSLCLSGKTSPLRKKDTILYVHSAYPCSGPESKGVFFGPDTYRYISLLSSYTVRAYITNLTNKRTAIDLCCGAGAGALSLAKLHDSFEQILGLDLNPDALDLARTNSKTANLQVDFRKSDFFTALSSKEKESVDLVICNPPYIPESSTKSLYADGGEGGLAFPLKVVNDSLDILQSGGLLVLYTGVCIAAENVTEDKLWKAVEKLQKSGKAEVLLYDILDNDVFGDEVEIVKGLGYIVVVGCVLRKL